MVQVTDVTTMTHTLSHLDSGRDINNEKSQMSKSDSSNKMSSKMINKKKKNQVRVTMNKAEKKGKRKSVKQSPIAKTITVKPLEMSSRKRKRTSGKCIKNVKKLKSSANCMITDVENVIGPNRTSWPEYCYYQIDRDWQQNACSIMGINLIRYNEFQLGGSHVILTRPDFNSLINVQADGNCPFCAFSYIITGSELQHMAIREKILNHVNHRAIVSWP